GLNMGKLVESAPDSCVFLSFFGEDVSSSQLVTKKNLPSFKDKFMAHSDKKYFYGALYSKLAEFSDGKAELEESVRTKGGYVKNASINRRALQAKDKNLLFIFTEGNMRPEDEPITFVEVTDYQSNATHLVPKVYAFYYTGVGVDENVELTLKGVSAPRNAEGQVLTDRQGAYRPSADLSNVLSNFQEVVNDAMYDFAYTYRATDEKAYTGRVNYAAEWKGMEAGSGDYSIGSAETPWPVRAESTGDALTKILVALLVAILTFIIFFLIMKVLIPFIKSKQFAHKYYKPYVAEEGVTRRICHYCRQDIQPGQKVVMKCKHIMHVGCWQQNGYKCVEYGQNCKEGIQDHVDVKEMFSPASLRDTYQTLAGVLAGLVSWMIFEFTGRGMFGGLGRAIANTFYLKDDQTNMVTDCGAKVSALLTVGLLLGFFLSLVFRYNDEYRKKDAKVYMKIVGLSLLSGVIGFLAMLVGGIIFCLLLSAVGTTYIPWYCSLPAYIIFSICMTLSLTIKSSIPTKSALIGGGISAIIGFIVLYFGGAISSSMGWLNMLLDFVIYGGGLGASLVTVRMLAERYFLVIKNGMKAGQRIPIHKWMNATGGGNKVTIGKTNECEIQMNWEKANKVADKHVQLHIDTTRSLPMLTPLADGVVFNVRTNLPANKPVILNNADTFMVGDTTFEYIES
ncbi:MAG: E3 ubiquitin protein ligase, partial [Prevotella sp.]|nr:E3 ubiquitin protein ligase [Prevotella sp.]